MSVCASIVPAPKRAMSLEQNLLCVTLEEGWEDGSPFNSGIVWIAFGL